MGMMYIFVLIAIVAILITVFYKKNAVNRSLKVLDGKVYRDNLLYSDIFNVKTSKAKMVFRFSNGVLHSITLTFDDQAHAYLFYDNWSPTCYGKNKVIMDTKVFQRLYNIDLSFNHLFHILVDKYPNLKPLQCR